MKTKCKHNSRYWQYLTHERQYPVGLSGTSEAVEYMYFLCKCGEVIKKEVVSLK